MYISREKKSWLPSRRICIDEISMRKGHQDFVTVVSDLERGTLIEVIDSHTSGEIIEVLMEQPLAVRETVTEVSVDMWGGFPKVAQVVFPNAVVVVDRFHVMKAVNQDLNKLRRKLGITDRGSKYLLLRNGAELKPEQVLKLSAVLERSPCLRMAYEMKESFRQIYETSHTVKSGRRQFEQWLKLAQLFFTDASATINNHFDGICNYFLSRTTSGVMEGINNKIKLTKRQGYRFSNFDNFRSRLLARFSN
jgi:transposase